MTKKITDAYCSWVRQYTGPHKTVAITLMKKIKDVDSIERLQKILLECPIQPKTNFLVQATDDRFILQLSSFTQHVYEVLNINIGAIHAQLQTLRTDEQTKDLVALLNEVLATPQILLYNRTLCLLKKLTDHNVLQNIFHHLAEQPQEPWAHKPQRGSFDAIIPRSKAHKTCIDLLHNNSKTFNGNNSNSAGANNLLQTLLGLYEDIHTQLIETLAPEPSSCTLL